MYHNIIDNIVHNIVGAVIVVSLITSSVYVFIKTSGKYGMCWLFWLETTNR